METINTLEKADSGKKDKRNIRTKDVFGKKLGNSYIIIFVILVLAAIIAGRYFVEDMMAKSISQENTEIKTLNRKLSTITKEAAEATKSKYTIEELIGSLPREYSHKKVSNDVINALWAAGISNLLDINYTLMNSESENPLKPIDSEDGTVTTNVETAKNLSEYVKAVKLVLTVNVSDYDTITAIVDELYGKSRIYYIGNCEVNTVTAGLNNAFSHYELKLTFYTFYEDNSVDEVPEETTTNPSTSKTTTTTTTKAK